jgi:hypothetical protein
MEGDHVLQFVGRDRVFLFATHASKLTRRRSRGDGPGPERG